MGKGEETTFSTVDEIFERYIPGYVPPCAHESGETRNSRETEFDAGFAVDLLSKFKRDLDGARTSSEGRNKR